MKRIQRSRAGGCQEDPEDTGTGSDKLTGLRRENGEKYKVARWNDLLELFQVPINYQHPVPCSDRCR